MSEAKRGAGVNEGAGLGERDWRPKYGTFKFIRYQHKETLIDPEKPWKIEKKIIIPFDILEKSPVEIAAWKNRELEKMKQRNFELYSQPHMFQDHNTEMATFILSEFFSLYPGSKDKLINLPGEILENAFAIVDYDHEKIEISKFIRKRLYCCPSNEFHGPMLDSIKKEKNKDLIREILSCSSDWKEPPLPPSDKFYQLPPEQFPKERIFVHYSDRA